MPYNPMGRYLNACECNCGTGTARSFAPGHDARLRGMLLRIMRGAPRSGDWQQNWATNSPEAVSELSRRGWLPNQHGATSTVREPIRAAIDSLRSESRSALDEDLSWIDGITLPERSFGIEMEFYGATPTSVVRAAHALGVDVQYENYTHRVTPHWKIVTDASVTRTGTGVGQGLELVSPILSGTDGIRQLALVSRALAQAGAKVNKTCGVHVHLDTSDLSAAQIGRTVINYAMAQAAIDRILPISRRSTSYNQYCQPIPTGAIERLLGITERNQLANAMYSRYHTVNLQSLSRHGTVEFRQHAGSIEAKKIAHWINLLQDLATFSASMGTLDPTNSAHIADVADQIGLNESTRVYMATREAALSAAESRSQSGAA